MSEPIAIIGAGIGGLTLAAALQKAGRRAWVFEQAEKLGEIGAGLGLWSNATHCLKEIGIDDRFWSRYGCEVHRAEMCNSKGRVHSRCDVTPISAKVGTGSYVVHRADLHRALAERVSPHTISLGKRLDSLEQDENGVALRFLDGSGTHASVVIGADGLRSRVRGEIFGDTAPTYAGQTCYRGIAEIHIAERHVLREVQGRDGLRAAVIPLDDQRVYWWATENVPEGGGRDPEDEKLHLLNLFGGWAFHVPEAIAATPAGAILRNDLYDRPPLKTWSSGHITLLGDAAHPTTPNLGQGACMAIIDAYTLGNLIAAEDAKNPNYSAIFSGYEKKRKKRCEAIVKESRRFGWIGGWENPIAVRLRESLLSLTPEWIVRRSLEKHVACLP